MEGKLKGQAVGRTIESLPISDALKGEAHWQESLIERYKSLYNDIDQDTQDYLFGFMHVTNRAGRLHRQRVDELRSRIARCGESVQSLRQPVEQSMASVGED